MKNVTKFWLYFAVVVSAVSCIWFANEREHERELIKRMAESRPFVWDIGQSTFEPITQKRLDAVGFRRVKDDDNQTYSGSFEFSPDGDFYPRQPEIKSTNDVSEVKSEN